jgi:hypothetical protein
MSTKAFGVMLLVLVVVGGTIGGVLFAFIGGDSGDAPLVAIVPTPTPPSTTDNAIAGDSIITSDGTRIPGGRQGLNFEPISGTLASLSATGLVVTSTDTGANTEVVVPPETPVSLSETAGDTSSLTPGTEIVAFLQRAVDGTITVTNINIGGFSGRGGAPSGGTTTDGTEFNAVPGTVTSYDSGTLVLETSEGTINVTVAEDTAVRLTITFADLTDQLDLASEITVIGQRDDAGTYTPIAITAGALGGFGGGGRRIRPTTAP